MNHQQSPGQSNRFPPKSAFLLSQEHGESNKNMSAKFDLLLSASNLLTRSDTIDTGLQHLTQMIVECWELSFCRIFLLNDEATYLETVALSPLPENSNTFSWRAEVGEQTAVSDWPHLDELLAKHRSTVIKITGKRGHILKKWSQLLALDHDLQSQLLLPLRTYDNVLGLLELGQLKSWAEAPFTPEKQQLAVAVAEQTAVHIERTQLLQKAKQSRDYFQTFSQASNALVMSDDPDKVWQTIMAQAYEVAAANRVRMFLIDAESYWAKDVTESGQNNARELLPHSKAMQIMHTGEHRIITNNISENEAGLTYMGNGAQATIGMPVSINGQRIGVMWFYYDDPRHFPQAEIEALQLYVNQAAIAYQNARRLKEVTHLHRAAEALGKAENVQEVLYQIVRNACQLLEADSAALFSYDRARNKFDPEYSVAYGIADDIWKQSQKSGPRIAGTAHSIFQAGWVGVHNVKDKDKYRFLGSWTQNILDEMGVHSFQAIALKLDDEQLGILYVNYKKIHAFFPEEQRIARIFGNHAAQALRNAQLLSRVRKARKTAGIVANVSTLANLEETLFAITTGLHDALRCDVVSVHVYDDSRERLLPLPTVYGAYYPERLNGVEKPNSPVVQLVQQKIKRLIAPDVSVEPLFKGSRFSRDEEIVSTAVFLLQFGGHIVGALFVNYRQPHSFLGAELEDIELLANQAAVAIHNAQLYERTQQRAAALKALHEASQAITSSLNRDTILQQIAAQACTLLNSPRREIAYTSIWLVEEERYARVVATHPPEKLTQTQDVVGDKLDVYAAKNGRRGIMSRVIQSGTFELVENVSTDPDYLATQTSTTSEMVVPILSDGKVIGAINVEHSSFDAFDREDVKALESLAMQATIAIQNAQLFKRTEEQKVTLEALFKAGKALSRSLDLNTLLNEIVAQAFSLTGAIGTRAQFSCLVMGNGEALEFVAAYPPERLEHLKNEIGQIDLRVEERFGVIGRAFKTGQPQLVVDVHEDGNYLIYDSKTRAELAVPLKIGEKVIGVINVEHPDKGVFDQLDRSALISLAGQAVVAIQNAETHRETAILQKVSEAFAGELNKEEILKRVLEAAVELTNAPESSILFWDKDKKLYHPAYTIDSSGNVFPYQTTARKKGTTHKIMKTQSTIVVNDVLKLPNANPTLTKKGRRSIVGVPVIRNGRSTAVLHVYSSEPNLFQEQQVQQLETLAGITGVALTKVQHYEELKKTKGMVGARTALAWMGMASTAWRHNIEGDAVNIRNAADLVRLDVKKQVVDAEIITLINQKLDLIHQLANQILDRPITPPLSSEEGVGFVVVNDLLRERTLQLWEDGKYAGLLKPIFKLKATKNRMVWASSEWLRRALDLVIDNAGNAMVHTPTKQLTITTAVSNNQIQIAIQDTGRGIPEDVQAQLFTGDLNLPKREGHLGRGLLMVQAIMETYGGEVCVQASNSEGTVMLLSLPVAEVNES